MRITNLELLVGLPGSGKSTYAKTENTKSTVAVADVDSARERLFGSQRENLSACVKEAMRGVPQNRATIIIDGLFLTNQDRINAIRAVASYYHDCHCTIHVWNEDRETCLKNDGGRRASTSSNTIQHAIYEPVNTEEIQNGVAEWGVTVVDVVPHTVQLKPDWQRFFRPHVWIEDGKLRSEEWSGGGAYGNCWHSSMSPVSAEEPLPFKALDDLLLKIVPDLTFLQYRRIQNECVTADSRYSPDYYGGGVTYNFWVCDLVKMYDILEEFFPGLCDRTNIGG